MKKLFFISALFISTFLFVKQADAQLLTLDTIAGVPDTVITSEMDTLTIYISKSGGNVFSSDLTLYFHTESDSGGSADTLLYFPQYTLNSTTDTILVIFIFNEASLDAGDNIVVVWPASSMQPQDVNGDSLTFHIHLAGVGIDEKKHRQSITLYPNPSRSKVQLFYGFPEKVEQVRVLDILGKEIYRFKDAITGFNVEALDEGVYFVEVKSREGEIVVKKFFRY